MGFALALISGQGRLKSPWPVPALAGVLQTATIDLKKFMERAEKQENKKWQPPPSLPPPSLKSMTLWKSPFLAGAAAGVAETTTLYWTVTWSIRRNAKLPMPSNFIELYRGYWLQLGGMVPLFAMMNSTNTALKKALAPPDGTQLTLGNRVAVAGLSGAITTIVSPLEVLQVQRNVFEKELAKQGVVRPLKSWEVAKLVHGRFGLRAFGVGAGSAALRNGIYSVGNNVGGQEAASAAKKHLPEGSSPAAGKVAAFMAASAVGILTSLASQPHHTVKTLLQADLKKSTFVSALDAAKKVYNGEVYPKKGCAAFLTGSMPRVVRIVVGSGVVYEVLMKWQE